MTGKQKQEELPDLTLRPDELTVEKALAMAKQGEADLERERERRQRREELQKLRPKKYPPDPNHKAYIRETPPDDDKNRK